MLVLEDVDAAKQRGARIYAEIAGYGVSNDAHHTTAPDPSGDGFARAIRQALSTTGTGLEEVDYISAHGTGTKHSDLCETRALHIVFGDLAPTVPMSSIKSMLGTHQRGRERDRSRCLRPRYPASSCPSHGQPSQSRIPSAPLTAFPIGRGPGGYEPALTCQPGLAALTRASCSRGCRERCHERSRVRRHNRASRAHAPRRRPNQLLFGAPRRAFRRQCSR